MDPNDIEIKGLEKSFAYQKIASEIDKLWWSWHAKEYRKVFAKLYYKQQETIAIIG